MNFLILMRLTNLFYQIMEQSKKKTVFLLFFLLFLFVTSCIHQPAYLPFLPDQRSKEKSAHQVKELIRIYPSEFKMSKRIIVETSGKEYDFIGYLAMSKDGEFRAITFGEMGGKFIELLSKKDKKTILSKPQNMPIKPLLDGVVGDIDHLFKNRFAFDNYFYGSYNNKLSLTLHHGERLIDEYLFEKKSKRLLSSKSISDGKVVRSVNYLDYRKLPGWDKMVPSKMVLYNYRWLYKLEIELLKINIDPVDKHVFEQ